MKVRYVLSAALFVVWSNAQNASEPLVNPLTRYSSDYTLPDQGFPGLQSNWDPPIDSEESSYVGTGRLAGRKALVTGGDSGIGRAVAIAFAREGADVAINYLPEEESDAEEVVRLVEAEGRSIYTIPGDLTDEDFCSDLVLQANVSLGGLDIVVNNAGFAFEQTLVSNISTAQIERTFRTNVFAGLFITRAAVPLLPPGSSILFTASNIAANSAADLVDYAATSAYLGNLEIDTPFLASDAILAATQWAVSIPRSEIRSTRYLPAQIATWVTYFSVI